MLGSGLGAWLGLGLGLGLGSGLGKKQKCERTDCEMEGCEEIGEKTMAVS